MKITGHVGIYKVKESFYYFDLLVPKNEIIVCGITADRRVSGQIWKGWHFDKDEVDHFNNRDKFFNRKYFFSLHRNQKYLQWDKLERLIE